MTDFSMPKASSQMAYDMHVDKLTWHELVAAHKECPKTSGNDWL